MVQTKVAQHKLNNAVSDVVGSFGVIWGEKIFILLKPSIFFCIELFNYQNETHFGCRNIKCSHRNMKHKYKTYSFASTDAKCVLWHWKHII